MPLIPPFFTMAYKIKSKVSISIALAGSFNPSCKSMSSIVTSLLFALLSRHHHIDYSGEVTDLVLFSFQYTGFLCVACTHTVMSFDHFFPQIFDE